MGYACAIVADSTFTHCDDRTTRLTTFVITLPRIVLAELNTHKMLSKNSASSRAIPVEKLLKQVQEDPYVPEEFGRNRAGMQATEALSEEETTTARNEWLAARDSAVHHAANLLEMGVHKQLTNRLLEPFMWHTVVITGTDWDNFFHLRDHAAAHPAIQHIAHRMRKTMAESRPRTLALDDWHLPFVKDEERPDPLLPSAGAQLARLSVGRCARVSYLAHELERDPNKDIELCQRLQASGHLSPFEHVARPMTEVEYKGYYRCELLFSPGYRAVRSYGDAHDFDGTDVKKYRDPLGGTLIDVKEGAYCGNLDGWVQYRKLLRREYDALAPQPAADAARV